MEAFSQQHHSFMLDSVFLPNSAPIKNSFGFMEEGNNDDNIIIDTDGFFSQFYPPEPPLHETPLAAISFHESITHLDHISKANFSDNEPSNSLITTPPKQSTASSSAVVDRLESGEQVAQMVAPIHKKSKYSNGSSSTSPSKDPREVKSKKQTKCSGELEEEEKKKKKKQTKTEKKVAEDAPTGYIHVRARRGQATDRHSLAERERREKISERMKMLQHLVPGCDKVTRKALMLDEIINYVQSLQNQVEFLSMKLAFVNPLFYDFGKDPDAFMAKPERVNNSMASLLPSSVQQCSQPTEATATADANNSTAGDHFNLIDTSTSLLLHGQSSHNDFTLDGGSVWWEMDDQIHKFLNPSPSGLNTTNLCSFH